jgi:hypothetical protein
VRKKVTLVLLAVVLLACVSLLVLYHLGSIIIDSALESVEIPVQEPANAAAVLPSGNENSPDDPPSPIAGGPAGNPEGDSGKNEPQAPGQKASAPETKPDTGDGISSSPSPGKNASGGSAGNASSLLSTNEVESIKASVTASDKLAASALVLSKLSGEDIAYLTGLLKDGLTKEEKEAAKQLCFARFGKEDIEKIYALYKKYMSE